MHSIIKNLSKVLALTTMVSSFTFLPGAKVSGTEPPCATFPTPPTSFDSPIYTVAAHLKALLNGNVSFGTSLFGMHPDQNVQPDIAYSILDQLFILFNKYPKFRADYIAYCESKKDRLFIGSFAEIPREKLALMCKGYPQYTFVAAKTSGVDRGMYFNCAGNYCGMQFIERDLDFPDADNPARFIVSHQFCRLMHSFYLSKGQASDPVTTLSRLETHFDDITHLIGDRYLRVSSDPTIQAQEALYNIFALAHCSSIPSSSTLKDIVGPEGLAELLAPISVPSTEALSHASTNTTGPEKSFLSKLSEVQERDAQKAKPPHKKHKKHKKRKK